MSNAKDQAIIKQANQISEKNTEIAGLRESLHHARARIAELTDQVRSLQNGYDLAMSKLEQLPEEGCLLQRTKGGSGYVGNAILWWKKNNQGYTTDPFDARVWPTEEAIKYTEGREDEYVAWPLSLIRNRVSSCVDMQDITVDERRTALAAAKKEAGR